MVETGDSIQDSAIQPEQRVARAAEGAGAPARFFADAGLHEALKARVFPEILRGAGQGAPVRIWVPGCGTGEEVYAIAIEIVEATAELQMVCPVQIFATDASEATVERARAGVYPDTIAQDVSPRRLLRFFSRAGASYQVRKSIRDLCVFARHDLFQNAAYAKLDLIICRGLLGRVDGRHRKQVLPLFHYALKPSGFLVIDDAAREAPPSGDLPLFEAVAPEHGIFAKAPDAPRPRLDLPWAKRALVMAAARSAASAHAPAEADPEQIAALEADRIVMARYAPPGVVVDQDLQIIQFRGHTGAFLVPPPGEPTRNLLRLVSEDLAPALSSAFSRARLAGAPVRIGPFALVPGGAALAVIVEIIPLPPGGHAAASEDNGKGRAQERHFLVLFEEQRRRPLEPVPQPEARGDEDLERSSEQPAVPASGDAKMVARLRRELRTTRENLQAVIEELTASNETLLATNEEFLASNEQLRHMNEELDTAREELQSMTEELVTVVDELKRNNADLTQASNDLYMALSSTSLPILVVSTDLRVRRVTPVAAQLLGLTANDTGRFIADLRLGIDHDDLEARIAQVLDSLEPFEGAVRDREGRWYALEIRPYRAAYSAIGGALLSLVEVGALREALARAERRIEAARAAAPQG